MRAGGTACCCWRSQKISGCGVLSVNIVSRGRRNVFHLPLTANHRVPVLFPDSLLDTVQLLFYRILSLRIFLLSLFVRFFGVRFGLL